MSWTGAVQLDLARRHDRTVAERQFSTGALKLMRPTHQPDSTTPHWTLMNPGGGYVGGDRYTIGLRLGPGSDAVLDGQAATKIYRSDGPCTYQRTDVQMDTCSSLTLSPLPLIAYRGARYVQETVVTMAPEARLVSRELVTAGWSPEGELFSFDSVRVRLRVVASDGRPVLIDNLVLEPRVVDPRSSLLLAGHTHTGTLVVVGGAPLPTAQAVREACADISGADCRTGVGGTAGQSVVVRCLGSSTQSVEGVLECAERLCRIRV